MKRLVSFVCIACLLFVSNSSAAPALIALKDLKLVATIGIPDEVSGVVTTGGSIVIYGTKLEKSYAQAINISGEELWTIELDPASQSLASAATTDASGNVWIGGSISQNTLTPTPAPSSSALNPDNVTSLPQDVDLTLKSVVLWRIDHNTHAVSSFTLPQTAPVLITSLAADKNGVTLVGITATNVGFVVSANLLGEFGKPTLIGKSSTTLDAVVRHNDGSLTVVGASSETLNGKKLVGITDGVIIKISKTGGLLSVVRSSATKAVRNWNSASSSLLLGGQVITGSKTESAITKFSSTYVPTWTYRFMSTGTAFTSGATSAFFASTAKIPQIATWTPKSARPILLTFDSKGRIIGANSAPTNQREVLGLVTSKILGVLCISASKEAISIYTPT